MHRSRGVRISMPQVIDHVLAQMVRTKTEKEAFKKLGLTTADQVLRFVPRAYLFPGELTPIRALEPDTHAVIHAKVVFVDTVPMRRRKGKVVKVILGDDTDQIETAFFNMPWLEKKLWIGQKIVVTGKVVDTPYGRQLKQAKILNTAKSLGAEDANLGELDEDVERELTKPMSTYPQRAGVNPSIVARVINKMLDKLPPHAFAETIPESVREELGLMSYREALEAIHRPTSKEQVKVAREWFKFEEAFALQVEILTRKQLLGTETAPSLTGAVNGKLDEFDRLQPFELTASQKRVGTEISRDLVRDTPMNRLLHGDVGSGKTLVALRAMLQAVDSGHQAALLAPTEILATQHLGSLRAMLGELASDGFTPGVRIELLTGSMSGRERKRVATELAAGIVDIVVGTHALLSDTTVFDKLGLVVIDEQHRFGVKQREQLREKGGGKVPHTLVMTATPIPRTVALTVYSDLEVSTLRELPGGPKQVTTHLVALGSHPRWIHRVWEVIAEHIREGEQAFVVASRIDSEEFDPDKYEPRLVGVDELADIMRSAPPLADARIETLHGKSDPEVKESAMQRFKDREFDILVATTVIEVGVDVHNARVMVVFDADRFGVAQLHQLRGRIGRDGKPAICFFVTQRHERDEVTERIRHVASTTDGFELAEYDLDSRKEGDVLGTSQWGSARLKFVSIRDERLILTARTYAQKALEDNPDLLKRPALFNYLTSVMQIED